MGACGGCGIGRPGEKTALGHWAEPPSVHKIGGALPRTGYSRGRALSTTMPNDPEHTGKSPSYSFFPTAEAPSFCSRQTPLVPARDDLRTFELAHARADASGTQRIPEVSESSRPTYVPDEPMDVIEAMADSGPVVTVGTPSVLEVPREPDFESKPPTIPAPPPTP